MRILIATDNFYPNVNGAARFCYELIKGLIKKGHQISVIAPSVKFENTKKNHMGMTVYGLRSVMIPKIIYPGGFRVPLTINSTRVKKIIEEIRPEVIHIQDHFMIGNKAASVGRKLGIPLIGTNNFMPENLIHYLYPPDFAKKPLLKFAWRQFINVYKRFSLITVPTKTAVSLLKNLGLKNRIIPISCGVDLDRFNPKNDGRFLKKRYKIADEESVVLFVGRLDKEKNIDLVIKSFVKILEEIKARLVIAGKGKEKSSLIKLARKLGIDQNINFTGYVSDKDLPALYKMADLFVIASIAELQSIATMEAMASSLPVVATKVMALPELVHNGKNGYLFNDGDMQTLANQIIKILKNPTLKRKMSKGSLKIISQHRLDQTIESYEKIYQKLILEQSLN